MDLAEFHEHIAAVVLIDAETAELNPRNAAADSQDYAPVGHVVEHRNLLSHPHRMMPGQHHHHRTEPDALRAAGKVGQILEHVGTHRVVSEVMLDAPQRIEAQRLREVAQMQIIAVNLTIGPSFVLALKDYRGSYMHWEILSLAMICIATHIGPSR